MFLFAGQVSTFAHKGLLSEPRGIVVHHKSNTFFVTDSATHTVCSMTATGVPFLFLFSSIYSFSFSLSLSNLFQEMYVLLLVIYKGLEMDVAQVHSLIAPTV